MVSGANWEGEAAGRRRDSLERGAAGVEAEVADTEGAEAGVGERLQEGVVEGAEVRNLQRRAFCFVSASSWRRHCSLAMGSAYSDWADYAALTKNEYLDWESWGMRKRLETATPGEGAAAAAGAAKGGSLLIALSASGARGVGACSGTADADSSGS